MSENRNEIWHPPFYLSLVTQVHLLGKKKALVQLEEKRNSNTDEPQKLVFQTGKAVAILKAGRSNAAILYHSYNVFRRHGHASADRTVTNCFIRAYSERSSFLYMFVQSVISISQRSIAMRLIYLLIILFSIAFVVLKRTVLTYGLFTATFKNFHEKINYMPQFSHCTTSTNQSETFTNSKLWRLVLSIVLACNFT